MNSLNELYLIGQVSKMTKVNIETIRYYERTGVMPKPNRSEGNQRIYSMDQINRLRYIQRSRKLGFSLKEIDAFVKLDDSDKLTCSKVHSVAKAHLDEVNAKIIDLQHTADILTRLTERCSRGEMPDCPITEELFRVDQH